MNKSALLQTPNYLLTEFQLEIYKELIIFKNENNLNQIEIAKKFNVSPSYINQILNGNFNFTIKKLIELGINIGKIPTLKFVSENEYWENKGDNLKISNFNVFLTIKINKDNPQITVNEPFRLNLVKINSRSLTINRNNYV